MSNRQEPLELSDARARTAAQRVFDRPLLLEAGAGTGKTTALVARVLAWCLGEGWERAEARLDSADEVGHSGRIAARVLRGVVAITFTEKAAADMSRRVGEALRDLVRGDWPHWFDEPEPPSAPDRWRERASALRGALDHLTMQTIHAWCRHLLADNALDAGLHPNLDVDADRRRQREVVREVLEERLQTAYDPSDAPAFLWLAARGIGPRELEIELLELVHVGVSPQALEQDPTSPERVAAFVDRFDRGLNSIRNHVANCAGLGKVGDATRVRLERTAEYLREQCPKNAAQLADWLDQLDWAPNEIARLGKWGNETFTNGEAKALGDAAAPLSAAARDFRPLLQHALAIDLELLQHARSVLVPLLAQVDIVLRQRGIATFAALLSDARALLCNREDVAAHVRSEIDQLMIDEFQDTDQRQCEIIRVLALQGPLAERPGLFLVGDPKQSIYGWRNADLSAYDAFVGDVLGCGGVREQLSVNYRSVPKVLDEVERCIAPVMVERLGIQPPFQPLIPSPNHLNATGFSGDGFAPIEHWIAAEWDTDTGEPRKTRSLEASELEARALAGELRELHDRHGVDWESIGVLFRSRTDWEIYLSALREAQVPYAVDGDRSYSRRREIIEATSLVRCVLDPHDHLALLTLFRSALVGVPDAALIGLWTRGVPDRVGHLDATEPDATGAIAALSDVIRDVAREVPRDVPGLDRVNGWEENLIDVVAAIAEFRASFATDPSDVFVERLRTRTLLEAGEAARNLGAWRCANLDRFFRDLRDRLADGGDTQALLRDLRRAVVDEEDAEEGRPVEIRSEAVAVMTIHGAKGLDFAHVYLMQLHKGAGNAPSEVRGASEIDGHFEYRLLGAATPNFDRVIAERRHVSEAERVRLLYVAMTRAKDRLVLSGVLPELQLRSGIGQPNELLTARTPGDLRARTIDVAASGATGFDDEFGARWVCPALVRRAPSQVPLIDAGGAALPTYAEVVAESEALRTLRAGAEARMVRPMGRAASAAYVSETPRVRVSKPTGREPYARQIGIALHRILEEFDFAAPRDAELARARDELALDLETSVDPSQRKSALDAGHALFDRVANGQLFARLCAMSDRIEARELPILCAPEGDDGPVGYWSGTIDLVYRDPETDRAVIADYKTDRIDDATQLADRAQAYRHQGAVYQRALRDALDLGYTPRFELWFFDADRIG